MVFRPLPTKTSYTTPHYCLKYEAFRQKKLASGTIPLQTGLPKISMEVKCTVLVSVRYIGNADRDDTVKLMQTCPNHLWPRQAFFEARASPWHLWQGGGRYLGNHHVIPSSLLR